MTPEERLANINQDAAKLKTDFESFKANQIDVNALENGGGQIDLTGPDINDINQNINGTVSAGQTASGYLDKYISGLTDQETKTQSSITSLQNVLNGKQTDFQEAYMQDISPARESLRAINERIAKRTAALEKYDDTTFLGEEQMRLDASGRDLTKNSFTANANKRRLERAIDRVRAAADIRADMAEAEYLQGNIESALDEIQMSLDIKYQPQEQALESLEKQLTRLQGNVDTAKAKQLDTKLDEIKQEKGKIDDAKNLILSLSESGYAQPEEIRKLLTGNLTPDEQIEGAMTIMARGASEDRQRAYIQSQQSAAKSAGIVDTISSNVGTLMASPDLGTSNDPMIGILQATAGGRALTQSETEPLTNARRVMGQLDTITSMITEQMTDPILGIARSNNPYDVKAQELKASLVAIVPQLARGIYGEVGVLTDTDVERYTKTLPNLTSTTDVNKALTALTLRNVRSAFVGQLESMAAAGRDVSGFVGIYQQMSSTIEQIENELQINNGGQDVSTYEAEFEAFNKGEEDRSSGFWQSLGNLMFGTS